MTLDDLFEHHVSTKTLSPTTIASYRTAVNVMRQDIGDIEVERLCVGDLENWKAQVLSRCSGTTWNNYHRHMKALFSTAMESGLLNGENLLKKVKSVRHSQASIKYCEISEITDAIYAIEQNPDSFYPPWFWVSVIKMLYYTGMRRRQIIGIKWKDVNYQNETLKLSAEHSKTELEWDIPITSGIKDVLDTVSEATIKQGKEVEGNYQIFNVTIFNHRYVGNEMTAEQLSGFFKRLRVKGHSVSPHKLRHTMATEICNQGDSDSMPFSLRTLQKQLGHGDITTTSMYLHPSLKAQAAMLDKLKPI